MMSQVLSKQSSGVRGSGSVRAHSFCDRLEREADADHGLTLSDYEGAPLAERRTAERRVDLSEKVVLTPSGNHPPARRSGAERLWRELVASDRRVVYAVLTDAGLTKVREASKSMSPRSTVFEVPSTDQLRQSAIAHPTWSGGLLCLAALTPKTVRTVKF